MDVESSETRKKQEFRIDKSTRDCRCRNSWPKRRRNVERTLPLPQQLARGAPQRLWNNDPKTQNMRESVTKCRTREKGNNRDRWQHEDGLDSSIYYTAPVSGGVASGQTHQNAHNLVPLLPSSIKRFWKTADVGVQRRRGLLQLISRRRP